MIISFKVTEEAIEYLSKEAGIDKETAEEILTVCYSLCMTEATLEDIRDQINKNDREKKIVGELEILIRKHEGTDSGIGSPALALRDALKQFISLEEERSEDRIENYKGKCYRHNLRFAPSSQFDNNCPACFWESKSKGLSERISFALGYLTGFKNSKDGDAARALFMQAERILSEALRRSPDE